MSRMTTSLLQYAVRIWILLLATLAIAGLLTLFDSSRSHRLAVGSLSEDAFPPEGTSRRLTPKLLPDVWSRVFDFVPLGVSRCQELFAERNKEKPFDERFHGLQEQLQAEVGKFQITEGYSRAIIEEYMMYHELVTAPFVRTVCETGFNAGHSALMWLAATNDTLVYSFDIGDHDYAKPMADYLQRLFPGRLTVTWGDSQKTLPEFYRDNPDIQCDIIVIDGGHTYDIAMADFQNFKPMASAFNILILDDYPSTMFRYMEHLGGVWEKLKRKGEILEVFQCHYMPELQRGFSVGRYNI